MLLASLKQGMVVSKDGRKVYSAHSYTHMGADSRPSKLPLSHCSLGAKAESLFFWIPSILFSMILWYSCIYSLYTHKYMFIQIHMCTYMYIVHPHPFQNQFLTRTDLSTNALHAHTKPTQYWSTCGNAQTHLEKSTLCDCLPKFPTSHTSLQIIPMDSDTCAHMHIHIKT